MCNSFALFIPLIPSPKRPILTYYFGFRPHSSVIHSAQWFSGFFFTNVSSLFIVFSQVLTDKPQWLTPHDLDLADFLTPGAFPDATPTGFVSLLGLDWRSFAC